MKDITTPEKWTQVAETAYDHYADIHCLSLFRILNNGIPVLPEKPFTSSSIGTLLVC
jgi:hypothetical protein